MPLTLRLPKESEEAEFLRAHAATSPSTPTFLHGYREGMPFLEYVAALVDRSLGLNLGTSHSKVPATFLFAFVEERIVGRVSIRHCLTPELTREGGHIGYVVVPEFRRQGMATEMLRQAIPLASFKSGSTRLLVTCHDDNVGSIRAIEKNGGHLENVVASADGERRIRRYWIEVTQSAA